MSGKNVIFAEYTLWMTALFEASVFKGRALNQDMLFVKGCAL